MLWEPLALAALNQPIDQAAAPVFARVLAEMFGADPRAAAIALPTKPLHQMYAEPARRYIEARGGAVRTGAAAKVHIAPDGALTVEAAGERWTAGDRDLGRAVVRPAGSRRRRRAGARADSRSRPARWRRRRSSPSISGSIAR